MRKDPRPESNVETVVNPSYQLFQVLNIHKMSVDIARVAVKDFSRKTYHIAKTVVRIKH